MKLWFGKKEPCANGWSTPMCTDEKTVCDWTAKMCKLGFEHDCLFDCWGTNPNQPQENLP